MTGYMELHVAQKTMYFYVCDYKTIIIENVIFSAINFYLHSHKCFISERIYTKLVNNQ